MVIVHIIGGLGNQMFQYAAGKRLSDALGVDLKLDISGFERYKLHHYALNAFNILENYAAHDELNEVIKEKEGFLERIISNINKSKPAIKYIKERHFHFDPKILGLKDGVYLAGYWQSEKYFKDIEKIIRREFSVKTPQSGRNAELAEIIKSTDSISLHVRRGDYVSNPKTREVHDVCGQDYYRTAMGLIAGKVPNPHFFVFSNDMEWVKTSLKIPYPVEFVDHNGVEKNYEDLRLMSQCKSHIIANSSFSWWGAWLCDSPSKIVIAPKKWFNKKDLDTHDLIPQGWIRI